MAVDRSELSLHGNWLDGYGDNFATGAPIGLASSPIDTPDLLSELVAAGVLTQSVLIGRAFRPVATPPATDVLEHSSVALSLGVRILHSAHVAMACTKAHHALTRATLYQTVSRISTRKLRRAGSDQSPSLERISRLIRIFDSWRAFFPRDYLCLYDSLALLEFLMHYGSRVDWVFGVTSDPFSAHCWLQHGNVVLNDSLDRVAGFSRILII